MAVAKPRQSDSGLEVFTTSRERDAANLALPSWPDQPGKPAQFFRRELAKRKQLGLYFASMGNAQTLTDQCLLSVAWHYRRSGAADKRC